MKKSIISSILYLFMSITITSSIGQYNSPNRINNNHLDIATKNDAIINESNITMSDITMYLETKKEHYPLSDEFIERYQQKSGGYIDNAKKAGLTVNKELHEPNQKWHFFDSWFYPSIEDGTLKYDDSAENRVYSKLLCPELLLWIYEACEVEPSKVKEAKDVAELGKINKTATATIAKNMRSKVSWSDLAPAIIDYISNNSTPYTVTIKDNEEIEINGLENEYRAGETVEFSIDVTSNDKVIDKVKINDTEISINENGKYQFTMPNENVVIEVTLKPAIYAESISLNPSSLELKVGDKNKLITATVSPANTTDNPSWSIIEGEDLIKITPNDNVLSITALKAGTASVRVSYNSNTYADCNIVINPKDTTEKEISVKYNIVYDLGTKTQATRLKTSDEILKAFSLDSNEDSIITSVSSFDFMYGGGNGGSNANKWYSGNMLKFGTQSNNGSLTLELSTPINRVIITGYVQNNSAILQIGDSGSSDWTDSSSKDNLTATYSCNTMTVASLDAITKKNETSATIDFESTTSLRIDTTNKKPLFMTSIEFIYYI